MGPSQGRTIATRHRLGRLIRGVGESGANNDPRTACTGIFIYLFTKRSRPEPQPVADCLQCRAGSPRGNSGDQQRLKPTLNLVQTSLKDVVVIEPKVFGDSRGFFLESYNERAFAAAGLPTYFAQDNHSGSKKGVLRGLHYQLEQPQGKLVRALVGEVFDVAVDLRQDSPTFGKWFGLVLSAENRRMLWIPPGFAHGFQVLSDFAEFAYKATDFYLPAHERTLLWNDPALGIEWPLMEEPTLSDKDRLGALLSAAETYPKTPSIQP